MTTTPVSLLERLRKPADQEAWRRFVRIYTPLLHFWAQRTGFHASQADDLVQEVFTHLVKEMPRFEYDKGKTFRGWLRTVARNKWNEIHRRPQVEAQGISHVEIADEQSPDPAELFATAEFQQMLYQRALDVMQTDFPGKTWQACKRVVMDGQPAAEVAAALDMTIGAVHAARLRVLTRLREDGPVLTATSCPLPSRTPPPVCR